ncbi:MAG: hypothetical protein IJU92_00005 [Spirochaetaceae bacterium]|nr:hypothetical protein [Spirochaetaceae bacterium]
MKKILLVLCLICIFCVTSCTKKETSLEGVETEKGEPVTKMPEDEVSTSLAFDHANQAETEVLDIKREPLNLSYTLQSEYQKFDPAFLVGRTYVFWFFSMKIIDETTFSIDYHSGIEYYKYTLETKNGLHFITVESPEGVKEKYDFACDFPDKTYLVFYNERFISFYGKNNNGYMSNYESPSPYWSLTPINLHEPTMRVDYDYKDTLDNRWKAPTMSEKPRLVFDPDPAKKTYDSDEKKQKAIERYRDPSHDTDDAETLTTYEEYLIWTSGYVSYTNPECYTEYARPKKICITVENPRTNDITRYTYDLADTAQPQVLRYDMLLFTHSNKKFTISIEEVYPGTKYSDVCVSSIHKYFGRKE